MDRHGSSRLSSGGARCKPRRTAPWAGTATGHPSEVGLRAFTETLKVSLLLVVVMPFKRESWSYALKVANSAARPTGAAAGAAGAGGGRAITSTPSSAYVNLPFCRRRCFYCDFPIKVVGDGPGAAEEAARPYVDRVIQEIRYTAAAAAPTAVAEGGAPDTGAGGEGGPPDTGAGFAFGGIPGTATGLSRSRLSGGGIESEREGERERERGVQRSGAGNGSSGSSCSVSRGNSITGNMRAGGVGRGGIGSGSGGGGGGEGWGGVMEEGRGREQGEGRGRGRGQGHGLRRDGGGGLKTLFFGGGTPSLCPPELVGTLVETVRECYGIEAGAEISIEMDPGTFDQERLEAFLALGVTRVSMGVQSFDAGLLAACGRAHSLRDVYEAVDLLQRAGVENFSIDLMSGLPNQTMGQWEHTLKEAVATGAAHVSVYDLQVEAGTSFGRWYSPGEAPLPQDNACADMYRAASRVLGAAGYEHYEISNYARPGFQSRHNRAYWENVPFLAFGNGAASYVDGRRFSRPRGLPDYGRWVTKLAEQGWAEATSTATNNANAAAKAKGKAKDKNNMKTTGKGETDGIVTEALLAAGGEGGGEGT